MTAVVVVLIGAVAPTPAAADAQPYRLAGEDRIETSLAIARDFISAQQGRGSRCDSCGTRDYLDAVVVARADDYADSLAGAALALAWESPLLLTGSDHLDGRVGFLMESMLPRAGQVFLLGGEKALQPAVEREVRNRGYSPVRLGGSDRYDTAALIAESIERTRGFARILVATGTDFPDALTAAGAAGRTSGVILLSGGTKSVTRTDEFLARHPNVATYCIGAAACQAYPAVTPVVGRDRYDTSAKAAATFFPDGPPRVGIASGLTFADALSGAPHVAGWGPLLLVDKDRLPQPIGDFLHQHESTIGVVPVYGGVNAVSDAVVAEVEAALR